MNPRLKKEEHKCVRCKAPAEPNKVCEECRVALQVAFIRGCKELIRKGIYQPLWYNAAKKWEKGWIMKKMEV